MFLELHEIYRVVLVFFGMALWGILVAPTSGISVLISLEIFLLAASMSFITFSIYLDDITGQVMVIFILAIAGAESALGLALFLSFNRLVGDISIDRLCYLKA